MFGRVISDKNTAQQIAHLLNTNNKLSSYYSYETVLSNRKNYIIETFGTIVAGCVQLERQSYVLTEIKHLVVHPRARGHGMSKTLVQAAMLRSSTPFTYATIRQSNAISQRTFASCGFMNVCKYTTDNRDVLLYIATSPKWVQQKKGVDNRNKADYTTP